MGQGEPRTMEDQPYSVRVSGPGLEMTKSVDQHVALNVLNVVMGGTPSASAGVTQVRGTSGQGNGPKVTVGEFLASLTLKNNQDRIAGIALYLREYQDRDRVTRDELSSWFQRAGEAAPKNLNRDLRSAVKSKLVAEDHERAGEFFVTATGESRVRQASARESTPTARQSSPATTRSAAGSEQRARAKRNATASSQGPMQWMRTLVGAGYLSGHRSATEIVDELARRGAHYKTSDLTRQLQLLVQEGDLTRTKRASQGTKREVWHYKVGE